MDQNIYLKRHSHCLISYWITVLISFEGTLVLLTDFVDSSPHIEYFRKNILELFLTVHNFHISTANDFGC